MKNLKKQDIFPQVKLCLYCKTKFQIIKKEQLKRKFCSTSCGSKFYFSNPENREKQAKKLIKSIALSRKKNKKLWEENFKQRSKRMKENNPMSNPKNIRKMIKTKKKNGTLNLWNGERGGNGKLTKPQTLLQNLLGENWIMEFVVITTNKMRKEIKTPNHYKIDIANPKLKIAIEIDGKNHKTKSVKIKDLKKEKCLKTLGWKVLRFWNWNVVENPEQVKKQILSII